MKPLNPDLCCSGCRLVFTLWFTFFAVCLLPQAVIAQLHDTATIKEETFADDDLVTEKHIYDSSTQFFNTKAYDQEMFTEQAIPAPAPSAKIAELKKDKAFWYLEKETPALPQRALLQPPGNKENAETQLPADQVQEQRTGNGVYVSSYWNALAWVLIVTAFVAGVVYFLASNKINLFARGRSGSSVPEEQDIGEGNLLLLPFRELLQQALVKPDHRLAVRVLYLQTLKLLSDRSLIQFQADFTNEDYLRQLEKGPYYDTFHVVTRHYEYSWYGKFAVSEPIFKKIETDFVHLQNMLTY